MGIMLLYSIRKRDRVSEPGAFDSAGQTLIKSTDAETLTNPFHAFQQTFQDFEEDDGASLSSPPTQRRSPTPFTRSSKPFKILKRTTVHLYQAENSRHYNGAQSSSSDEWRVQMTSPLNVFTSWFIGISLNGSVRAFA